MKRVSKEIAIQGRLKNIRRVTGRTRSCRQQIGIPAGLQPSAHKGQGKDRSGYLSKFSVFSFSASFGSMPSTVKKAWHVAVVILLMQRADVYKFVHAKRNEYRSHKIDCPSQQKGAQTAEQTFALTKASSACGGYFGLILNAARFDSSLFFAFFFGGIVVGVASTCAGKYSMYWRVAATPPNVSRGKHDDWSVKMFFWGGCFLFFWDGGIPDHKMKKRWFAYRNFVIISVCAYFVHL